MVKNTSNTKVTTFESHHDDDHHNLDLRGTFVMVMMLGGLMVTSWLGAFILFMSRM